MVFLDLKRDRYVQLPERLQHAVLSVASDPINRSLDVPALQALVDHGLIEKSPRGRPLIPTSALSPSRSLLEDGVSPERLRPALLLSVAADLLRIRNAISKGRPQAAVTAFQERKLGKTHRAASTINDIAVSSRAFLTARRMLPIPCVCLLDSLTLAHHLARQGALVDLVFGVKLNPFRAHAWVQCDDLVLDDSLDRVLAHHPIRIV